MSVVLAKLFRGELVESVHRGDWVITDSSGHVIYSGGNPHKVTYWRSAAKPFQAIPVVESGAYAHYRLSQAELALMCASHNGESFHVATARSILEKVGLGEDHLKCGVHPPAYRPAADALCAAGEKPSEIHCNCSGKHGGMLALSQFHQWDLNTYLNPDHPLQKLTVKTISDFTGIPVDQIVLGTDGCGVPVFGLPISGMARAWAILASPDNLSEPRRSAVRTVGEAMRAHPEMIGGTGRLCTQLMQGFKHIDLVAKAGAEAVYCFGLPKKGWGFAMKVEDGNSRAIPAIVLEILEKLGYSAEGIDELKEYRPLTVKNHHNEIVGKIVAEVEL